MISFNYNFRIKDFTKKKNKYIRTAKLLNLQSALKLQKRMRLSYELMHDSSMFLILKTDNTLAHDTFKV